MTQYRFLCEPLPLHTRKEPVYLIPPWPHAWPYFSNEWARDWECGYGYLPTAAEPILVFRTHSPQELVLFSLFLQPIQFQLFPILCSPWGGKVKTNSGAVVTQRQIGSGRCSPDPLYILYRTVPFSYANTSQVYGATLRIYYRAFWFRSGSKLSRWSRFGSPPKSGPKMQQTIIWMKNTKSKKLTFSNLNC